MARWMRALLALVFLVGFYGLGCGGTSPGYVPVDSPVMEFEPPAQADLIEEEEEEEEEEEAGDESWMDDMDDEAPADKKPASKK